MGLTAAARRPLPFLRYLLGTLTGPNGTFGDILNTKVTNQDIKDLVELITMGTCSVPPEDIDSTYMIRAFSEMWSPSTKLQYPKVRKCTTHASY